MMKSLKMINAIKRGKISRGKMMKKYTTKSDKALDIMAGITTIYQGGIIFCTVAGGILIPLGFWKQMNQKSYRYPPDMIMFTATLPGLIFFGGLTGAMIGVTWPVSVPLIIINNIDLKETTFH